MSSTASGSCCDAGVDSAQPLFSSTNTTGSRQSCARFIDSWKAPVFVAPSPKKGTAMRGSPRILKASAAPAIIGSPPPTTAFAPMFPRCTSYRCIDPPNPPEQPSSLAVHLRHHRVDRCALGDRVRVRAMGRRDHVVGSQRGTDAAGDRFLANRDVEEARQLTCAEALLDLLLEAPDHEHLAKQLAQASVGQRRRRRTRISLHLGHRASLC